MPLPDGLVAALRRPVVMGEEAQAFAIVTVDEQARPHIAFVSAREVALAADGSLHAVLAGRRTRTHLAIRREATLLAVEGETCHSVVLRLQEATEEESVMVAVFEVADHRADSVGIALSPISYVPTEALVHAEHWERADRLLAASLAP